MEVYGADLLSNTSVFRSNLSCCNRHSLESIFMLLEYILLVTLTLVFAGVADAFGT